MKIVIIGGGIAGLTAGILLYRKGFEVVICERETGIPDRGNAFLMHAEADAILKRLTWDFRDLPFPGKLIDSFCLRRPDNRIAKFQKLDPWHCITRKDIINLLYRLVPEDLPVRRGCKFTGFRSHSGQVKVAVFENGTTESGDIFIGADGGPSEVRQQLFGPTSYTPVEVKEILGGLHAPELSRSLQHTFTKFQHESEGLSCGIIPTSDEAVIWYMQYDCTRIDPEGHAPDQLKAFCLDTLKGFPELVVDTLRRDDFSNAYVWNTRDFDLLPKFHSGNVVLIGDAAHLSLPFTSAGTTNAFVDAATLADLIGQHHESMNLEETFTAYYDSRAGRIASQIQLGRDLKKAFRFPDATAAISVPLIGRQDIRPSVNESPAGPKVRLYYFTDPICSTCWASQPQLRKLSLEYRSHLDIEYKMGGLLPSWEGFSRHGIRKPSDVAVHWEQVCTEYHMPMDASIWLKDPLPSSYPPSVAFKAAQLQDTAKAILFLRKIRELLFLESRNIIERQTVELAAYDSGLDTIQLMADIEGRARQDFIADLELIRSRDITQLPTLLFQPDGDGSESPAIRLEGFQPYTAYENMVRQVLPGVKKEAYDPSPESLFQEFHTMTLKEFSFLRNEPESNAYQLLKDLTSKNLVRKFETEAGNIWLSNYNSMDVFK